MTVRDYAAKIGMDERNPLFRVAAAKVVEHGVRFSWYQLSDSSR
jgi:hypothetical protein